MIHFGFSTYTFPTLTLTADPRSHDSHLSPITASFIKKNYTNI